MTWQTVIGLEVHAQLNTASKLFSSSATTFGAPPNSHTNFIDAGFPGTLPVLNQEAVTKAIQFGLAIHAEILNLSFFERKNYFYPDSPKGYQISQFQRPIVSQGALAIAFGNQETKTVIIERAHLEEDAGKSLHDAHPAYTGIDLNRAGTPLLEIVTTPCLFSAEEAIAYLKTLHHLLLFLNICDGNMQEGSFRCDVNLSLRRMGTEALGTRTELKNLNSFRFIEQAIHFEQERHQECLERGEVIVQETRQYCPNTHRTLVLRSKEHANEYRYFPDPDLLPIQITPADLAEIKASLPELPSQAKIRLEHIPELSIEDSDFLLTSPAHLRYYDEICQHSHASPKMIVNWLRGPYSAALREQGKSFHTPLLSSKDLASLLDRITDRVITNHIGKQIFSELLRQPSDIDELIHRLGYDTEKKEDHLETLIQDIIAQHPQQTAEYRAGKEKLWSFFVGQVMKQTKGQADPEQVTRLLHTALK